MDNPGASSGVAGATELFEQPAEPANLATLLASDTVQQLESPEGVRVILLGTAHISKASVAEARQIVRTARPRVVFVELCRSRQAVLNMELDRPSEPAQDFSVSLLRETWSRSESGGAAGLMQLALYEATKAMTDSMGLDVSPGAEFAAAAQEAFKYGGLVGPAPWIWSCTTQHTHASSHPRTPYCGLSGAVPAGLIDPWLTATTACLAGGAW